MTLLGKNLIEKISLRTQNVRISLDQAKEIALALNPISTPRCIMQRVDTQGREKRKEKKNPTRIPTGIITGLAQALIYFYFLNQSKITSPQRLKGKVFFQKIKIKNCKSHFLH